MVDARPRLTTSRHEEILESFDRVDKLTTRKKGSLKSTIKKTVDSTEHACNKSLTFQEIQEHAKKGRLARMADAESSLEDAQDVKMLVSPGKRW